MNQSPTWQNIQNEVLRRIAEREWIPGQLIPKETELAAEFKCARTTVNRALQSLAEAGYLDRRRKAGTRIALHPIRKATLSIPITRHEIESRGAKYRHEILSRRIAFPPKAVRVAMKLATGKKHLHLKTLFWADDIPFMYEDRWINVGIDAPIADTDFKTISANEWLVDHAFLTTGDITFSSANASTKDAEILAIDEGMAIFIIDRITWNGPQSVTAVRLAYAPGFTLQTKI